MLAHAPPAAEGPHRGKEQNIDAEAAFAGYDCWPSAKPARLRVRNTTWHDRSPDRTAPLTELGISKTGSRRLTDAEISVGGGPSASLVRFVEQSCGL
jgi:hypothetical protein